MQRSHRENTFKLAFIQTRYTELSTTDDYLYLHKGLLKLE